MESHSEIHYHKSEQGLLFHILKFCFSKSILFKNLSYKVDSTNFSENTKKAILKSIIIRMCRAYCLKFGNSVSANQFYSKSKAKVDSTNFSETQRKPF